ncbi:unnamed protein product [Adineta ricciae]|uniref:Uncharacterized protein n=1 Tax=Adineta ricciae TaxID=249248 RepID=A0A814JDH0_ADIRI|nr:unnamed protein product [Adineta ricciae]
MTSTTSSRHIPLLQSITENTLNSTTEETAGTVSSSYPTNQFRFSSQWSPPALVTKTTRAYSCHEERAPPPKTNNRLKHLCTQLKRRFSSSKECETRHEDTNRGLSIHCKNYKTFSSSLDDTFNNFEWPDFEQIYDTIPPCLAKALPGLDDLSLDESDDAVEETANYLPDECIEQVTLYEACKRGKHYRRNAICRKLDKSVYKGQLNTFIQQLMIEKLMRTWT